MVQPIPVGGAAAEQATQEDKVARNKQYPDRGAFDRDNLRESPGFYKRAWRKLRKDKLAMFGLLTIVVIALFAFGAPIVSELTGHTYDTGNYAKTKAKPFEDTENILGTDDNGRDILTRLAYGGRISMMVAFIALFASLTIGMTVGAVSGFFGGAIDSILMRIVDVVISIPSITLLLLLSVWIRPGPVGLAFVIAAFSWTGVSRLIRGEVLSLKNRDYIDAARVIGSSNFRIITKHIFPNVVSIVIVWASLALPSLILTEATLSYLGFGVRIPIPSWGNMLDDARGYYMQSWTAAFFPGFMIFMSALSINLLGNGMRDALDPRLGD
jgi:peptide/nickel transport system permease protein